jgi:hypothetical protein
MLEATTLGLDNSPILLLKFALDALNEALPVEGRSKIFEALIPNGNVRNLLFKKHQETDPPSR